MNSPEAPLFHPTPIWKYLLGTFLGFLGILAGFMIFASLSRGNTSAKPITYSDNVLQEVEKSRDISFDPSNPPVLHVDVTPEQTQALSKALLEKEPNLKEGVQKGLLPKWAPRGESPILSELVEEGKIPPVHERVGPEPIVMTGKDGIGEYGGTWLRIATSPSDVSVISWRLSGSSLVRYSPLGYPIKMHLAKNIEQKEGGRIYDIQLRKGIRWSDGHPLDAGDILYWWVNETNDKKATSGVPPAFMRIGGKAAKLERTGELSFRVTFAEPNALFLDHLVLQSGKMLQPEHYLKQYHPTLGDESFIKEQMELHGVASKRSLYGRIKNFQNPDHPRLWPWIYRTYKTIPPPNLRPKPILLRCR